MLPMAHTLNEVAANLVRLGYTRYACPTLPARFPKVVETFAKLTQSADAELLAITDLRELHEDGKSNLGLRQVRKGELKENPRQDEIAEGRLTYDDTKFYYHGNQRTLGYFANRGGVIERHRDFFLETTLMNAECVILGLEITDRMDALMPGYNFAKRMLAREDAAVGRLLRYLCDGDKPNIAQMHRDQNFLTVHIKSDRPQLWLADRDGHIIADAQETRDDSVLIFLCRKAWQITRGALPGIWHGVLDPTFGSDRVPRHTAVNFLHATVTEDEERWTAENIQLLRPPQHLVEYSSGLKAA
jgi:hypothetical protein